MSRGVFLAVGLVGCLISIDNACDEFVADNIFLVHPHKTDALDVDQQLKSLTQAAALTAGKVNLQLII